MDKNAHLAKYKYKANYTSVISTFTYPIPEKLLWSVYYYSYIQDNEMNYKYLQC